MLGSFQLTAERADLMEQLDALHDSAKLVESLIEKNLDLQDHVTKLEKDVRELEEIKMVSEEIEECYAETEKELREELAVNETALARLEVQAAQDRRRALELERKMETLRQARTTLEEELDRLSGSGATTAATVAAASDRMSAMVGEMSALQSRLRIAEAALAEGAAGRAAGRAACLQSCILSMLLPDDWSDDLQALQGFASLCKLIALAASLARRLAVLAESTRHLRNQQNSIELTASEVHSEMAKFPTGPNAGICSEQVWEPVDAAVRFLIERSRLAISTLYTGVDTTILGLIRSSTVLDCACADLEVFLKFLAQSAVAVLRFESVSMDTARIVSDVCLRATGIANQAVAAMDQLIMEISASANKDQSLFESCPAIQRSTHEATSSSDQLSQYLMADLDSSNNTKRPSETPTVPKPPPAFLVRAERTRRRLEEVEEFRRKLGTAQEEQVALRLRIREYEDEIQVLNMRLEQDQQVRSRRRSVDILAAFDALKREYSDFRQQVDEAQAAYELLDGRRDQEIARLQSELRAARARGVSEPAASTSSGFGAMDKVALSALGCAAEDALLSAQRERALRVRAQLLHDLPGIGPLGPLAWPCPLQESPLQPLCGPGPASSIPVDCRKCTWEELAGRRVVTLAGAARHANVQR
mmetsp:Transcript_28038/g.73987  ORF Transcript_28038/g.73987 Transcript_28038/m.73987 type:complete len:649 (+) Transcript_28038:203-2149(+)